MQKEAERFNDLVLELIQKIEAARIECERMRHVLHGKQAFACGVIAAPSGEAAKEGDGARENIIDARGLFIAVRQ